MNNNYDSWTRRAVRALLVLLIIAIGARVVYGLLVPLVPAVGAGIVVIAVYVLLFSRRH